jgi:glycosyltransferase involved in cell wall biosynthesis
MKKKLFVDAHTFDENHQGIRTFLKGIYEEIDLNPNQVEVILVANKIENLKKEFKNQNFKYIKLKYENKYLRLAYEIPKLIKTHNIDFAHFNYFLPLFLSRKCKYIVTIHDILFIDYPQFFPKRYQLINTFLFKRSARKADMLTTVSEYSRERIIKHFKIKDKSISILPNAVNSIYKQSHEKESDKLFIKRKFGIEKYIILVSRLEPRKNHITLLEAYKELKLWKKGYSMVFIGKETFKNQKLKSEINLVNSISHNKIYHLTDISELDLVKFYNAAEFSVFPSLCEGFGIPPLESAAMKTPTLCSNVTAMGDYDFFGDYLFDPHSKSQLKIKIEKIIDSKIKMDLNNVSKKIQDYYSWQKTAKILSQLILRHEK